MDLNSFHFANPLLLFVGIVIPCAWILYVLFYRFHSSYPQLEKFIDKHLLPYLLLNPAHKKRSLSKMISWSLVWACLTFALAGPRWNFREVETYSSDQTLVIILDLSESMNTQDIKPTRLVQAKHKIEDLLNLSKETKIGLIVFAADPHMVVPITDDKETIRYMLPSLETHLMAVQGSRISPALSMASGMLQREPGHNKSLLVMSDGGFEDGGGAILIASKLKEKEINIYSIGIGTDQGAFISEKKGSSIVSKLEKEKLIALSEAGGGRFLGDDDDEMILINEIKKRGDFLISGRKNSLWSENFYFMIIPVLPILLCWFRRGSIFIMLSLFMFPVEGLEGVSLEDYFKNTEELGQKSFLENDYEKAVQLFQDPYRKGVASYKAGNFAEAEKYFRLSKRKEIAEEAAYNLGNALALQNKLKEAIHAYEEVLKEWKGNIKAKENLEIVKKMLEEQKKSDPKENESQESDSQESDSKESESKESESKESESKEQSNSQEDQKSAKESKNYPPKEESEESSKEQEVGNEKQKEQEEGDETNPREKTPEDQDADLLLNRLQNNQKQFLKNKFYIESKKNGTKEGIDPW